MSPAFTILFACALPASLTVLAAPAWESKHLREIALQPQRSAQAQVVSLNTTRMTAEIAGPIQALPVEPGQVVRRGEVLARLDCRNHEIAAHAAVAVDRAALETARCQVEKCVGRALARHRQRAPGPAGGDGGARQTAGGPHRHLPHRGAGGGAVGGCRLHRAGA